MKLGKQLVGNGLKYICRDLRAFSVAAHAKHCERMRRSALGLLSVCFYIMSTLSTNLFVRNFSPTSFSSRVSCLLFLAYVCALEMERGKQASNSGPFSGDCTFEDGINCSWPDTYTHLPCHIRKKLILTRRCNFM